METQNTTIKVTSDQKDELESLKIFHSEPYSNVIKRLLNLGREELKKNISVLEDEGVIEKRQELGSVINPTQKNQTN